MTKVMGRPPKYETPEEMQEIIDTYFLVCMYNTAIAAGGTPEAEEAVEEMSQYIPDRHPTVSGLSYSLGMSTEALRNYEGKGNFLATVKGAKQRVEMSIEQSLMHGKNAVGPIFNLKNNFGWVDKKEIGHEGSIGLDMFLDYTGAQSEEPECE